MLMIIILAIKHTTKENQGNDSMRMKKAVTTSTIISVLLGAHSALVAADDHPQDENTASNFSEMFEKSSHSGEIRFGYLMTNPEVSGENTVDDFAAAGQLKIETAPWNGFLLGGAFYTSHSITQADDEDYNDEFAGPDQHYDLLAEAYIDYTSGDLNLRLGRQVIDTPFADSDDIRMTPHTFEALVGNYELGNGFNLTAGWMTRWQGVDAGFPEDAGFDDMVQDSEGTFMLGGSYGDDIFEASAWYYSVDDVVNVFYGDITLPITLSEDMTLTLGAQLVLQHDDTNSKTAAEVGSEIGGELYGVMAELTLANITFGIAWDHANVDEGEALFGGWGGGPFFTNIDTLVANEFAAGQDADSYTVSLGYDFAGLGVNGLSIGYTYGHYEGGADPFNAKADAEVEEHNFGLEYEISDSWFVDAVYVLSDDKENSADTEWDYDRFQTRVTFVF